MILSLLLGTSIAVAAAEGGLRFLLFSDSSLARKLGASLRKPEYFADGTAEDEYWKLQFLFLDAGSRHAANNPDPLLGWVGSGFPFDSVANRPSLDLGGRKPVLLYGDSYAVCVTPPEECFQAILERSDLADRYCLVNYGVGGYGFDQIYLLLVHTIDRWRNLDPIVIVSFFVDDDFDRDVLTFRCWPKPHLSIQGDGLVPDGPVITDPEEYLARNPLRITSYFYRLLAFHENWLPARLRWYLRRGYRRQAEKVALGRKILEETHRELEKRGLRHFFLAFHGENGLRADAACRWADEMVEQSARELGVPLVAARPFLLAAAGGEIEAGLRFFGGAGNLPGHYNALGNRIAFEAIRAGIEGKLDPLDTTRAALIGSETRSGAR